MTDRQNTYAPARLQGSAAALAAAMTTPVNSPTERCVLLFVAASHGDMGVSFKHLDDNLAAFCAVPPARAMAALQGLARRRVLGQDGARCFMVAT